VCSWVSAGGIFGPVFTSDLRAKKSQRFLRGREISGEKIGEFFGQKIL